MTYVRVLVVALVATVALAGCARASGTTAPSPPPMPPSIATGVVRQGDNPVTVSGYGAIGGGANGQASLAFAQSGRIASVDVTIGRRVAAGEVLARLDPGPFESEVRQAEAALINAEANATKVAAGARPQQIAQTDAQITSARSLATVAKARVERQRQLVGLGVAARADLESAESELSSATANLRVLEQQQSAQRTPWQPDLVGARATVAQAQAQVAAARQRRGAAVLRAPFAGVVTARLHQDGESVDPSSPILTISNASGIIFTAQFSPADAQRVHVGDVATIVLSGAASESRGRVTAVNPAQNVEARTIPVLIALERLDGTSGPGAYGKAAVRIGSRAGLYVPKSAIVSDPTTGVTQVFRRGPDGFAPVRVTVTAETSNRSWIVGAGLRAGDRVATEGAYGLLAPRQQPQGD